MKKNKIFKIKCDPEGNLKRMPWKKLKSMQGDFKVLDDEGRQTLRNSLEEVGFIAPFFVWYGKDFLLDGVQRTDVLDDMEREGWKIPYELPVVSIEAKTKKEAIANIARFSSSHGIVTTQGAINLFGIEGLKIIAPTIRIPQLDIQEILLIDSQQDETTDVADLIDRAAELNKKWKVKTGNLWLLGEHRILCGDATKKEDVERLMDGQKADMVFTDPPYGLGGYGGRNKMTLQGDDQDVAPFYKAVLSAPEVYVWGRVYNLVDINFKPRDIIVWRKNNFGLGRGYRGQYEVCFYKGDFSGSDSDVWDIDKDTDYMHPTQKPVELCQRAIKNSKPETVLDQFLGSGTTLIACEKQNRKCYGMDIDPKYCAVTLERWHQYTGLLPEKIEEA